MSLRQRLAEHGFESNEDHEFALRCLMAAPPGQLRLLNVCGDNGRRKTAFAHALGQAWEFPFVLYHDFSDVPRPVPTVIVQADDEDGGSIELPMPAFDRTMIEACALSEGARVICILDQLQCSEFREHLRLYRFTQTREWTAVQGSATANAKHLLLVLISEQPLYTSLQKASFRIWTDPHAGSFCFEPEDFGCGDEVIPLFRALALLFDALEALPTASEFAYLLADLRDQVRTPEQLRVALYGRVEAIQAATLRELQLAEYIDLVVRAVHEWHGVLEITLDSANLGTDPTS